MPLMRCQWLALTMTVTVTATLTVTVTLPLLVAAAAAAGSSGNTTAALAIQNNVLHFAYELEQWLDLDASPCNDFVAYACGKSLNASKLQLEQRLQQERRQFEKFLVAAEDPKRREQLLDAELKVKYFHESCQQARSLDELKSSLMYRQSGGWPALDDTAAMIRKRRNMTWLGVLAALHDAGVEDIFQLRVQIISNKRIVHLEANSATHYTLRRYEQLADEVMREYGVEESRARLVALETLNFERNRREIASGNADAVTQLTYENFKSTLLERARTLGEEWDAYFRHIIGKPLKPSDAVLVRDLPRLIRQFELLQNTTMTRLLNWVWIDYLMDKRTDNCAALVQEHFAGVYGHIVRRLIVDKVQMAQMYAALGRAYEQLLPQTPWIDEMSQQNSQQFLNRILHLTLNGDESLDAEFAPLVITSRNFYRNLEKVQRFRVQRQRNEVPAATRHSQSGSGSGSGSIGRAEAAGEFMQIFSELGGLLQQQNLSTPLDYWLIGEQFAERMIAGGGRSATPGAWRSMDSERAYNANDVLLKLLAQQQLLHALGQWHAQQADVVRRLDNLLSAGRLRLSMRKLHFIGALLADCRRYAGGDAQRQYVAITLRNTREFSEAFGCRPGDSLHASSACRVLHA